MPEWTETRLFRQFFPVLSLFNRETGLRPVRLRVRPPPVSPRFSVSAWPAVQDWSSLVETNGIIFGFGPVMSASPKTKDGRYFRRIARPQLDHSLTSLKSRAARFFRERLPAYHQGRVANGG